MDFTPSPRAGELTDAVRSFIRDEIAPVERELHRRQQEVRREGGGMDQWRVPEELPELQRKARAQGYGTCSCPPGMRGPTRSGSARAAAPA